MIKRQIDVIKVKRLDKDLITAELITIVDDLHTLYEQVECDTIDIQVRRFGGVNFDVVLDDEFLINGKAEKGYPTAIYKDPSKEQLFGNLLLCHHDDEGNLTSVDPQELLAVQNATYEKDGLMILIYDIEGVK